MNAKNKSTLSEEAYTPTQNACKLCTPFGAALAFKGVENTIPLLHGSQGCATYIRRYIISHFKEPVDIASSNFSEDTAIFGGGENLKNAIRNIALQYKPDLIGIASTCLSETIGDDVAMIVKEYKSEEGENAKTEIVSVSTPSYSGTHSSGFFKTVAALVHALSEKNEDCTHTLNLFSGMISPEDIRYLKRLIADMKIDAVILPDYSETLDGTPWKEYCYLPKGGTPLARIRAMGGSRASIECGRSITDAESAAFLLNEKYNIPFYRVGLPIGIRETDHFMSVLSEVSGRALPREYSEARARCLDAYADGHKYVFGARAVIYGDDDFVVGMASFLDEIGMVPALCATGSKSGRLREMIAKVLEHTEIDAIHISEGVDFFEIEKSARESAVDIIIGSSKGFKMSRALNVPLLRLGFPIHDRFGGARILHLGYHGALALFDMVVNALLEKKQHSSEIGYTYL
jgi:nitrogenase molybdenum-iron protein NifN